MRTRGCKATATDCWMDCVHAKETRQPWLAVVFGVASLEPLQREPRALRKPSLCRAKTIIF